MNFSCSETRRYTNSSYEDEENKIVFSETKYDFGNLDINNEIYSHTFEFNNMSTHPVLILQASSACQCTTIDYNIMPIKTGETGTIKVMFNPKKSGKGYFNKQVKVRINSTEIYTLNITGRVL